VIGWPSATLGEALRVTGVTVSTSMSSVVAADLLGSSFSKSLPLAPVMVAVTGPLPLTASSGVSACTVPDVWPTGMVMTLPLLSVTTTGVPATAAGTVAV
jgi:hypothetical protein